MTPAPAFVITPGPHLSAGDDTARIMWWVNGALAPATLWGVWVFGPRALAVIAGSLAGALGGEWAANRALRRPGTLRDGSAFCTGLLLALTLPPLVPWWTALLGGLFAILVGKSVFGGLGFNVFNPALVGRAFLMAGFPVAMTTAWAAPRPWFGRGVDAVTTATPLGALKLHGAAAAARLIAGPGGAGGLALGMRPGSIGEVSVLLVALGAAALLARGVITLTIPLAVFAGAAAVTAFSGAPWLHLLGGGLWLGAFFMATDYVTSPPTRGGRIVFGLVIGALTGVIRLWGGYPEGICYAILIGNALAPALRQWFRPRRVALAGAPS
ncbi:MAG TPA: RnfABCDGE type electron transport complex subunit D [Candidatus Eisenbacteria bacterium]|nr:RnfABCDGE type electron transport complex subunit D [Candidatus Eisenbacteria bacterium]